MMLFSFSVRPWVQSHACVLAEERIVLRLLMADMYLTGKKDISQLLTGRWQSELQKK